MSKGEEYNSRAGYELLSSKGVSRRDFLKLCSLSCVAFGLNVNLAPQMAEGAAARLTRKPVIWMQGQGCTGCSSALLSSAEPTPEKILLDLLSVRFHPTLMAAAGDEAANSLEQTIKEGSYLLILEGSLPTRDPRFCMVEGKPLLEQFKKAAAQAEAVIAVGSCAAYGGIPRAGVTGAVGAREVLENIPVVNLPSCPLKPERLAGTLLYYLGHNEWPRLDQDGRPVAYYRYTLHDSCYRRLHFERGEFLQDWNDPRTVNWCLYEKGCKGQETYTDCAKFWWNDHASFCGYAGSPCAGCSQPEFFAKTVPLYTNPREVE
ncbi:MAG: hydrogenase small subunit [Peptococcaceae bacterium]